VLTVVIVCSGLKERALCGSMKSHWQQHITQHVCCTWCYGPVVDLQPSGAQQSTNTNFLGGK